MTANRLDYASEYNDGRAIATPPGLSGWMTPKLDGYRRSLIATGVVGCQRSSGRFKRCVKTYGNSANELGETASLGFCQGHDRLGTGKRPVGPFGECRR